MGTWVDSQQIMCEQQMCLLRAVFPGRSIKRGSSWVSTPGLLFCLKNLIEAEIPNTGQGPPQLLPNSCGREKGVAPGSTGKDAPRGQNDANSYSQWREGWGWTQRRSPRVCLYFSSYSWEIAKTHLWHSCSHDGFLRKNGKRAKHWQLL